MTMADEAERALDDDRYDDAIDASMASIAAGAEIARAARIAGRAFQRKGMHRDAIVWLDRSIASEASAIAHAWRAWSRWQRNENDAAAADYDRALALDDALAFAHWGRGLLFAERGETDAAIASLGRAVEDPKLRASVLYERGRLRLESGDTKHARADLLASAEAGSPRAAGKLLELDADTKRWSAEAWLSLASFHGSQKDHEDEQAAAYEAAIAKLDDPTKKHDALLSLALCLRVAGRTDDSVAACERALVLRPDGPARAYAGRSLFFADRNRKAEKMLVAALTSTAEPFEAHLGLGELYAEEEKYEKALSSYESAVATAPRERLARTQCLRGEVLAALGRDDACRDAWLAAERAGSERARDARRERFGDSTPGDFFSTALACLESGDWDGARTPLERAAEGYRAEMRAPGDLAGRQLSNVLNNLAQGMARAGEHGAAIVALEEAIRAWPTGYSPYVTLGNVLGSVPLASAERMKVGGELLDGAGRTRAALAALDRAAELALGEPFVHYNRGCALMRARDGRAAAADFRRALAYENPSHRQDAAFNLVKALWKGGLFAEARAACDEIGVREDVDTMAKKNIEAMLSGRPTYEGNLMAARFADALDVLLKGGKPAPGDHPFRFYGVSPADWQEGANMGHVYRLVFVSAPSEAARTKIAKAAHKKWKVVDDRGSRWRWSGRFAELVVGEKKNAPRELFREIAELMSAVHGVAPLEEVVANNALRLTSQREEAAWERWSLRTKPLPCAHPFANDGRLFFSAYGDVE